MRCVRCTETMPLGKSRTGCGQCYRRPADRAYRAVLAVASTERLPALIGSNPTGATLSRRRRAARRSR